MTDDDRRLMMEISAQADIAYQSRPWKTNSMALAKALGSEFPHRKIEDIHQKIRNVWRLRGLLCQDK